MNLHEFSINFPELFTIIDDDIKNVISAYQITGEESIRDWDILIDNLVKKYEQNYRQNTITAQQYNFRDRDRDFRDRDRYFRDGDRDFRDRDRYFRDRDRDFRDRDFRHKDRNFRDRFHDFDLRDSIRLLFLRKLFDRNRY